jgi:hypothetical protein
MRKRLSVEGRVVSAAFSAFVRALREDNLAKAREASPDSPQIAGPGH